MVSETQSHDLRLHGLRRMQPQVRPGDAAGPFQLHQLRRLRRQVSCRRHQARPLIFPSQLKKPCPGNSGARLSPLENPRRGVRTVISEKKHGQQVIPTAFASFSTHGPESPHAIPQGECCPQPLRRFASAERNGLPDPHASYPCPAPRARHSRGRLWMTAD